MARVFPKESFVEDNLNPLGKGSYGVVVEARLRDEEIPVAIKLVPLKYNEGLSHQLYVSPGSDCIVRPLGVKIDNYRRYCGDPEGRKDDCFCLVMEKGLLDIREPFSKDQVKKITLHLLLALDHLHRGGLIHGDVKPDNIIWFNEEEPVPLLADFDLMTSLWPEGNHERAREQNHTVQTWNYRAPEHWLGRDFGTGLDVWAAGCVLFKFLFGSPFVPGGKFDLGWLQQRFEGTPLAYAFTTVKTRYEVDGRPISSWYAGDGVDPAAMRVLCGMLHPNPKERLSTTELLCLDWFDLDRDFIRSQQSKSEEFWRLDQKYSLHETSMFSLDAVKVVYPLKKEVVGQEALVIIYQLFYAVTFLQDHPEIRELVHHTTEHVLLEVLAAFCEHVYPLHQGGCDVSKSTAKLARHIRGQNYPVLQRTTPANFIIQNYRLLRGVSVEELYEFVSAFFSQTDSDVDRFMANWTHLFSHR